MISVGLKEYDRAAIYIFYIFSSVKHVTGDFNRLTEDLLMDLTDLCPPQLLSTPHFLNFSMCSLKTATCHTNVSVVSKGMILLVQ